MKYHIWTVGCQMNVADSRKLAAGLDRAGLQSTDAIDDADLVVLNTCAVREHAEDRAIGQLGRLHKQRKRGRELTIAVMGCMVGPRHDDLRRRFPYVDVFARPQEFAPIMAAAGIDDTGGEFWPSTFARPDAVTAFVPVIHGCDKFCTYCIVPYRRGREQSRTIEDIRSEVEHYCARGVKEVTLLGQTVEAYGHDLPDKPDLGDLMRAIHDVPGLERIRFLTSYPKDMTARIVDAVAELPKVCENFNIPVQAGDDDVLARMRRGYTLDEYIEKFELVRAHAGCRNGDGRDRRLLRRDGRRVPKHVRPAGALALRQGTRRGVLAAARDDRAPQTGGRRAGGRQAGAPARDRAAGSAHFVRDQLALA